MRKRVRKKSRELRATGWNAKAKALRFGDHVGVLRFRECRWWHVDMTGALVGPITRREAYLTATSYMNAAEIAAFGAEELQRENEAEWAAQSNAYTPEQGDALPAARSNSADDGVKT